MFQTILAAILLAALGLASVATQPSTTSSGSTIVQPMSGDPVPPCGTQKCPDDPGDPQ